MDVFTARNPDTTGATLTVEFTADEWFAATRAARKKLAAALPSANGLRAHELDRLRSVELLKAALERTESDG